MLFFFTGVGFVTGAGAGFLTSVGFETGASFVTGTTAGSTGD